VYRVLEATVAYVTLICTFYYYYYYYYYYRPSKLYQPRHQKHNKYDKYKNTVTLLLLAH